MRIQRDTCLLRTFVHASQPRARICEHVMPGNCANNARNAANDPAKLTGVGDTVDGSSLNTRALVIARVLYDLALLRYVAEKARPADLARTTFELGHAQTVCN
ncbi:unnamed protein product [Ectocarpus sp. 6 AP-2014]